MTPASYDGDDKNILTTIKAVYLSDLLIGILYSEKPDHYHKLFRKESKKLLGFSNDDIENVLDQLHVLVEEAGDYFGLKIKNLQIHPGNSPGSKYPFEPD